MPRSAVDVFTAPPSTSIDDVLARMDAIADALPPTDGIACFNRLYRRTTENIRAFALAGKFADAAGLERLDVVFANLYFGGVAACLRGDAGAPRAWLPLVEQRAAPRVHPLQFAIAGMNAHINRDLAVALRDKFTEEQVLAKTKALEHASKSQGWHTCHGAPPTARDAYICEYMATWVLT
jgi:hypothetical protein